MEKSATLNIRVNPIVKKNAEEVLNALGIPMSTAIDMYLNQISLTGGIPFPLTLPQAPKNMNMSLMTEEELTEKLMRGINDAENGRVQDAAAAFQKFKESLMNDQI